MVNQKKTLKDYCIDQKKKIEEQELESKESNHNPPCHCQRWQGALAFEETYSSLQTYPPNLYFISLQFIFPDIGLFAGLESEYFCYS